jgi:hypothetical protein
MILNSFNMGNYNTQPYNATYLENPYQEISPNVICVPSPNGRLLEQWKVVITNPMVQLEYLIFGMDPSLAMSNGAVNLFGNNPYTQPSYNPYIAFQQYSPQYSPQYSNIWDESEEEELPPIPEPIKPAKKPELPPIPNTAPTPAAPAPAPAPAPIAKTWKTVDSATIIAGDNIDHNEAQRLIDEINKQNGTAYSVDQLQQRASIKNIDSTNDLRQLQQAAQAIFEGR